SGGRSSRRTFRASRTFPWGQPFALPLLGDHKSRSDRPMQGIHLVAGLGSHWAGVRADFPSAKCLVTFYSRSPPPPVPPSTTRSTEPTLAPPADPRMLSQPVYLR